MNTTDTGAPVRLADLMSGGDMRERVAAKAMKRAVVRHLDAAMRAQGMTQAELARRMGTSAAAVHRLLDRDETGLTLATLARASTLLGVRWRIAPVGWGEGMEGGEGAPPLEFEPEHVPAPAHAHKAPARRRRVRAAASA
ncbi:MAG: helix-turn-helix transcriptional regulator [Ottowia sp.]|nr:helix-turn-helix transcriptional regulator [Ottowia sp.]